MTESKKPTKDVSAELAQKKSTAPIGAELSDADLNKASGGAYDAFRPAPTSEHAAGLGANILADKSIKAGN